ncbi:aminotransferase [Mycena floridula]|nr:aminotransferase [Mycena floridula]
MDFQLLTSLRYENGDFVLLSYHTDRLNDAAQYHGWSQVSVSSIRECCETAIANLRDEDRKKPLKLRVTMSQSGNLNVEASVVQPLTKDASLFNPDTDQASENTITLHLDSDFTVPSLFTSTKASSATTKRDHYNQARARVKLTLQSSADVLLFNPQSQITEASISNVAFYRKGRWITPPASSGCLPGVFRRWLLEQGRIHVAEENELIVSSVKDGEYVLLFNAVRGCQLAQLKTSYKLQKE